jgi:TonB family protein
MGFNYSVSVKYLGIDEKGVNMPIPKSLQMPDYPIDAMRAGASDYVLISFVVTDDGSVQEIKIDQANLGEFGTAAKNAIAKWTFTPGVLLKDREKVVPVHMRCRLDFRATEG